LTHEEDHELKQILQNLGSGATELVDVPIPAIGPRDLLVRTRSTLVSAGTERMLVDFGRASWLSKALQQPDKVRQVFDKVRTDGLLPAVEAVRAKLEQPIPLGYCNVGTVVSIGSEVSGYCIGDRVASNGAHAELVVVPRNLCVRVPDEVSDDEAAFTVLGAVALQGLRLVSPVLGECFAVTGLGLIGLLAVQLLKACGCRVLGIDPDSSKTEIARQFGAEIVGADEDPVKVANALSRGRGLDGVLITAATKSSEPISQAARMCRKRGRIVLVGVTGLELSRADFYEKELTFQVSCSYGPGRYDPAYEEGGHDYPVGFVRWTEQRNFEAVLDMLRARSLDVKSLVSHRFRFSEAPAAYDLLGQDHRAHLGILLEYERQTDSVGEVRTVEVGSKAVSPPGTPRVGFIGAGNYATRVLIPAFAAAGGLLQGIASNRGFSAAHHARKFGFARASTDAEALVRDSDTDILVIATRHDSHSSYVCQSLAAGKHVFVEKPLALSLSQLEKVERAWEQPTLGTSRPLLMVGFNRRFAPHIVKMKALLESTRDPKAIIITVNAGIIQDAHWIHDPAIGGGRIIGEGCHFIDLARHIAGHPIVDARVRVLNRRASTSTEDAVITLGFADGSWSAIHYLTNGHRAFPKERVEVFCGGRILHLDNFRRMRGFGWGQFTRMNLWRQDKGQQACVRAFLESVRRERMAPIPFNEILEVARVSVALGEAART
jgi:predicted dehydrogenase/threonine dehydrogenase-like Zn-dependent dehydrogenase